MIFYEDFVKKLSEVSFDIKKKEVFYIELKKMISVIGVGIALFIIALYQGYLAYMKQGNVIVRGVFAIILLILALKQLKVVLLYKLSIDTENKILVFNGVSINLNEIKSCSLEERKVAKHFEAVLNIITEENKQFIIPFYMNKKLRFAFAMKQLLGNKFTIKTK